MDNVGKWFGYNYENKTAIPIISQEKIQVKLRTIPEKPFAYKNINSSSIRLHQNTNLTTEQEKSN